MTGNFWELYIETIKSEKTRIRVPSYFRTYMQHWLMYNDKGELDYAELLKGDMQSRVIHFIIHKKKLGRGSAGIENYINCLTTFYKVHGKKKEIDWELVRSYLPEKVKKTKDREYYADEVISIEKHLDERGKVVSGLPRGSGVRRGGENTVSIGDLFPRDTPYGKIYKMWVYRGTADEYPTACTPEIASRIDDYLEYRMRFGEACKLIDKDHVHEYHDGEEVIQKSFARGDVHLNPDAPLIREDFDKRDKLHVMNPRRLTDERISDIIREAAIASGIRVVNKGQKNKRHKVMIAHGFRKLFKKRCRQAKVDPIILERFMGHKSGDLKGGVNKLMMIYDPEEWEEMEQEFIKAIPNLTINRDAQLEAALQEKERENVNLKQKNTELQGVVSEVEMIKKKLGL